MPAIQLEQHIDLQRLSPTKWRLVGLVGQAIFFYAEAGSDTPEFVVGNQLSEADIGSWRAIDGRRRLVIGQGGMATVKVAPEDKNKFQVTFNGTKLAV